MSDNPFIEPEDSERTVIRPMPGGRRSAAPDAPVGLAEPPRPSPAPGVSSEGVETFAMGLSPLVAAAAPLLQLMIRLRNTVNQPDPGDLRERAVQAMRRFEQQSRDTGVPIELLRPAHYALCASLDDVVLNTPWGSTGVWDARSLVSTFHQEVRSGERFFDLLTQMRQNPGRFLPVIELIYLCMSRVSGPLPAVAARAGRARPFARGNLCADLAPASAGRTGIVAALERLGRALPRRPADRAGVGRRQRCAGHPGRIVYLVFDDA